MPILKTANLSETEFSKHCRERKSICSRRKKVKDARMNADDSTTEENMNANKELGEE